MLLAVLARIFLTGPVARAFPPPPCLNRAERRRATSIARQRRS